MGVSLADSLGPEYWHTALPVLNRGYDSAKRAD